MKTAKPVGESLSVMVEYSVGDESAHEWERKYFTIAVPEGQTIEIFAPDDGTKIAGIDITRMSFTEIDVTNCPTFDGTLIQPYGTGDVEVAVETDRPVEEGNTIIVDMEWDGPPGIE